VESSKSLHEEEKANYSTDKREWKRTRLCELSSRRSVLKDVRRPAKFNSNLQENPLPMSRVQFRNQREDQMRVEKPKKSNLKGSSVGFYVGRALFGSSERSKIMTSLDKLDEEYC